MKVCNATRMWLVSLDLKRYMITILVDFDYRTSNLPAAKKPYIRIQHNTQQHTTRLEHEPCCL